MTIAFTNGIFDLLHEGHIHLLKEAATKADMLLVGINSDQSTKRLKGETRPTQSEKERAKKVLEVEGVSGVIIFNDDTPLEVIKKIRPDVLIKGDDYSISQIVGAAEVMNYCGTIVIIPRVGNFSSTQIIDGK